jgi:hypothetical protein
MENITRNSDDIAEYRKAKDTAEFLLSQSPKKQTEWINDLIGRLESVENPYTGKKQNVLIEVRKNKLLNIEVK